MNDMAVAVACVGVAWAAAWALRGMFDALVKSEEIGAKRRMWEAEIERERETESDRDE